MRTKNWLMRAWNIDSEIDALMEQRKELQDRITSVTAATGETVQSSKDPHKFDSYLILCEKLMRRLDILIKTKEEIIDAISTVSSPTLRTILLMRYVNNCPWDAICDRLGYEHSQISRLHGIALKEVEEYMKEKGAST